jgi:hypothetical protein
LAVLPLVLAARNRYNRVNKALIAKSDLYAGVVTDLAII